MSALPSIERLETLRAIKGHGYRVAAVSEDELLALLDCAIVVRRLMDESAKHTQKDETCSPG